MDREFYYWLTIVAMLYTMLAYLRKSPISEIVSCAAVISIYASGAYGALYNLVYETLDSPVLIDSVFLLIVIAIVFATWLLPEMIMKLFFEKPDIKGLVISSGKRLLMWIVIYGCIIIYNLAYDNSTPFMCSLIVPTFIAVRGAIEVASKPSMAREDKDDCFTIILVMSVGCFFVMLCFNSLIGRDAIVDAMGVDQRLHYTVSVALIPVVMLFLPIFFAMRSMSFDGIFCADDSGKPNLKDEVMQNEKSDEESGR